MKPTGTYKLSHRGRAPRWLRAVGSSISPDPIDGFLEGIARSEHRVRRILESLRDEILEGGGGPNLRIRRVFQTPREIFRLELTRPELGYQRTTFLDRDALEELLGADEVRQVIETGSLGQ
jgi:hypothetical protein